MKRTAEDIAFSEMVRSRAGYKCERCGTYYGPKHGGLHCAHVFSRAIKRTRCDPDNALSLCYGCHSFFHKHPLDFHAWVRENMGEKRYDLLTIRAKRLT